jgi:hypothetical protein
VVRVLARRQAYGAGLQALDTMPEQFTPRGMVKAFLRGELPPRPLLLPIIFSLGSRLENVSLRDFHSNPTKIANALRQIRIVLKVDGLACYFDRFLEAEALGCQLEWQAAGTSALASSPFSGIDHLRQKLQSPDEIVKKGRIRIASEVLQRLKVMLKDEPALMVGVTGPLTLATLLLGESVRLDRSQLLDLMEFTAEITAAVSKTFVEAGADVVFLMEDSLPEPADACERWAAVTGPITNVIRFYDALPVLILTNTARFQEVHRDILDRNWNGAYCLGLSRAGSTSWERWQPRGLGLGVALPPDAFSDRCDFETLIGPIRGKLSDLRPILVTSTADIPPAADLKQVVAVLEFLRNVCSSAASSFGEGRP